MREKAMTEHARTGNARDLRVFADDESLIEAAATIFLRALARPGRLAVCLTGGEDARVLYERLARDDMRARIPFGRVSWFLSDERFVARDDARSNQRLVREALLKAGGAREDTMFFPPTLECGDPQAAADAYEATLKRELAERYEGPLFDLVLHGLGPDGHTAALFPGKPGAAEQERLVVGVPEAGFEPFVPRVSLTHAALGSSGEAMMLIRGKAKREALERVLSGADLPGAQPTSQGPFPWLVDAAAAHREGDA
jgi:6-phosphogluconolactonase